ncbi:MAG: methyltransferase [Thermoanaerobaculia bacterium]
MSGPEPAYDPASYRDRHARVFHRGSEVLRGLSPEAASSWHLTREAPFFRAMVGESKIIDTEELPGEGSWVMLLRHARIPVISYPYEWSFGMLRQAADLQLEITQRALRDGIALRDATPYNVQWIGPRPTFIDVTSFEKFAEGSLWTGYRQFCELFLFPLLLQSYRNVDFHPWIRGNLDGIPASQMANLLSARDRLRPGVFTHVVLQAKLQNRFRSESSQGVNATVRRTAGASRDMILANVRRLRSLVDRLRWELPGGGWEEYERRNTYSDADREMKEAFVRNWSAQLHPRLAIDIGCNTGGFAQIAAESSDYVLAVDSDHAVIERLYQRLVSERVVGNILPLVWDVVNPSPGLGWNCAERRPLEKRVEPDLVLALAVIHHLVIGRNVPLADVITFFAAFRSPLVIEFVDRHDPMTRHLLEQKDEPFEDYSMNSFEDEISARFEIIERRPLPSGSRTLYFARPRL